MKPIDIGLIQARRKKIEQEIAEENQHWELVIRTHSRRLEQLKIESQELDIAERVFTKLTNEVSGASSGDRPTLIEDGGKPAGTPPMPEMIKEALAHAKGLGTVSLKPAGILSYIQGKWWAAADINNVAPIAWRMWQRDDLVKYDDGTYALMPEGEEEKEAEEDDEDAA